MNCYTFETSSGGDVLRARVFDKDLNAAFAWLKRDDPVWKDSQLRDYWEVHKPNGRRFRADRGIASIVVVNDRIFCNCDEAA